MRLRVVTGLKASASEKLRLDPKPLRALMVRASAGGTGAQGGGCRGVAHFFFQLKKYRKRKIYDKSILYSS